ncbi:MAG: hypothetical protein JXN60_03995, partial [Lentisphaerae bacterium]|nr:hypothetical protein [Lentisphaerota bacterium]
IVTRILRYGISSAVMLTLFYLMAIYIAVNASQTGELVPLSGLVFGALIMATGIAVSCLAAYQPYKRHRHKK